MPIVLVHGFACTHADWRMQSNFSPPASIENYPNFARALFEGMFLSPSELGTAIVERAMRLPEAVGADRDHPGRRSLSAIGGTGAGK